jgi:hypothetical protein
MSSHSPLLQGGKQPGLLPFGHVESGKSGISPGDILYPLSSNQWYKISIVDMIITLYNKNIMCHIT